MPSLFFSYARANSPTADKVHKWLGEKGWKEVFRDTDLERGVHAGEKWRERLYRELDAAEAGIILVSPEWARSEWCQIELTILCERGKSVFPVRIAETSDLSEATRSQIERFQIVDISSAQNWSTGLARLEVGLKAAGLEPRFFPLDKRRPLYPGLSPFEEEDAAVFFGRDEEIKKGLESLRQIRDGTANRALCILGASGAGKSSFLRAGLLARLRRDTPRFALLPLIRPEQAAVSGSRGLAASFGVSDLNDDAAVREALRMTRRKTASTSEAIDAASLTVVVAVDQAEELFSAENKTEGQDFLKHVARIAKLDPRFIVIFTIRSDTYEPLQTAPAFAELRAQPLDLPPISSPTLLDSIIQGPGKLVRPAIIFNEDLVRLLVDDLSGQDALPLLALALQRLVSLRRGTEVLSIEHYRRIGGLKGLIEDVAERALADSLNAAERSATRPEIEGLARRAFIPALVRIESKEAAPLRRAARIAELPPETRGVVSRFVNERLLVRDGDRIEIAHEAILRQWSLLKSWIEAERGDLILAENVLKAATDWRNAPKDQRKDFLAHRGSLYEQADALRKRNADWAARIAPANDYLDACKKRDDEESDDLLARDRRNLIQTQRLLAGNADQLRRSDRADGAMRVALLGELDAEAERKGVVANAMRYACLAQAAHEGRLEVKAEPHTHAIPCIAFSPDGGWVVTGAQDGVARLIDTESGAIVRTFVGHRREWNGPKKGVASEKLQTWINGIGFDRTGALLATGSSDRTVRIWEVSSGRELRKLQAPDEVRCLSVAKSTNLIAGGCTKGKVCVWTFDGQQISTFDTGNSTVLGVALSVDGTMLAVGKENGLVGLHDVSSGVLRWEKPHGNLAVSSVAFAPAGDLIVSASHDLSAIIWDVRTGDKRTPVRGHTEAIRSVAFNATGKKFATAGGDGTVRVWDVESGRQVLTLGGHDGWVQCVAFAPDDKRLASGGFDATARIWYMRESFRILRLRGLKGFVSALAIHPNGRTFAVGGDDAVRVVSCETGRVSSDISALLPTASDLEFAADGSVLFATDKTGRAVVVNTSDGSLTAELSFGHDSPVRGTLVAGRRSAIIANDRQLMEWAWESKKPPRRLASSRETIELVASSPDGSWFACADVTGAISIFDSSGGLLKALKGELGPIQCLRFDPTGRALAAGARDRPFLLRLWDTSSWNFRDLPDHTDAIWGMSFTSDGTRLATACRDRHVRIFRTDEGVVTGDYALEEQAQSVAFAPNGQFVVTGGRHGQLQILDSIFPAALSDFALVQTVARYRLRGAARRFTISERLLVDQLSLGLDLGSLDLSEEIRKLTSRVAKGERDKQLAAADAAYGIWREHREASFGPEIVLPPPQPPRAIDDDSRAASRTLLLVIAAVSTVAAVTTVWLILSSYW